LLFDFYLILIDIKSCSDYNGSVEDTTSVTSGEFDITRFTPFCTP